MKNHWRVLASKRDARKRGMDQFDCSYRIMTGATTRATSFVIEDVEMGLQHLMTRQDFLNMLQEVTIKKGIFKGVFRFRTHGKKRVVQYVPKAERVSFEGETC